MLRRLERDEKAGQERGALREFADHNVLVRRVRAASHRAKSIQGRNPHRRRKISVGPAASRRFTKRKAAFKHQRLCVSKKRAHGRCSFQRRAVDSTPHLQLRAFQYWPQAVQPLIERAGVG